MPAAKMRALIQASVAHGFWGSADRRACSEELSHTSEAYSIPEGTHAGVCSSGGVGQM